MSVQARAFLAAFSVVFLTAVVFDTSMLAALGSSQEDGPVVTRPSYAPNGREVAFWTDWRGKPEIWVVSTADGRLRPVADGMEPAWSPNGLWIAFVSFRAGNWNIWLVRPDGSSLTQLTTDRAMDDQPAWSPDGMQLAFVSTRAGARNIWLVGSNGSGLRRITNPPGAQNHLSFSPDGTQLVFETTATTESYLMIMNADGTGSRRLTTGGFRDLNPSWGTQGILFDSNRFGSWGIKMIQPDGSGLQSIPNVRGSKPTWSPNGTKVAFKSGDGIYEFNFLDGVIRPLVQLKGFFISIDIMPGGSPKAISLKDTAPIRILIPSASGFDPVQQIDLNSLTFGRTGDERSLASYAAAGVNLVCDFKAMLTGFRPGDMVAILRATKVSRALVGGRDVVNRTPLEGRATVQIVP